MTRFGMMSVMALLGVATVTIAEDDLSKKDIEKLQGVWKVTVFENSGMNAPEAYLEKLKFTFKGNEMFPNNDPKDPATLILDPSKKPAHLNLTDSRKKMMFGIYELDGDNLKICVADAENDATKRPTKFATEKNSKTFLMVLKREKK